MRRALLWQVKMSPRVAFMLAASKTAAGCAWKARGQSKKRPSVMGLGAELFKAGILVKWTGKTERQ